MSYASIASHNIPAGDHGVKPDQDLLDGQHFEGETEINTAENSKLNVLPPGEDPHHPQLSAQPTTAPELATGLNLPTPAEPHTSNVAPKPLEPPSKEDVQMPESGKTWEKSVKEDATKAENKAKELEKKGKAELAEAESRLGPYWEKTKDVVLRPGTLGGLMGIVNVGLLGTVGYFAYTRKDQPWDRRIVGGAVAGTLALFGAEGFVAESYLQTPEGKEEAERAKKEGSKFYLQAKEVILRPSVAGGLVGALNVAVIGTVGYFSYKNWDKPWDRRIVSAVAVGLLGLSGLEGWAGKEYKEKELPKR